MAACDWYRNQYCLWYNCQIPLFQIDGGKVKLNTCLKVNTSACLRVVGMRKNRQFLALNSVSKRLEVVDV